MADYPPYMNAYGNVAKILNKIKDAQAPERFSQDYLDTVLGFSGGSARPFISLAKRIGLLNADGTPSPLYHRFRNPAQSEQAMAEMIRKGYPEFYRRNEYAHLLDKAGLQGLIMEATGLDSSSDTLRSIAATFDALKSFANFELSSGGSEAGDSADSGAGKEAKTPPRRPAGSHADSGPRELLLAHNIYINLPDTTNIEVFNAIFKAMKTYLVP